MKHLLDNPVWHALNSGNQHLATGNEWVKSLPAEISPFVGLQDFTTAHFNRLYELLPPQRPAAIFVPNDIVIPDQWKVTNFLKALQLVCINPISPALLQQEFVPLGKQHIPAMIALTQLTTPGPFLQRTIEFGQYKGIFSSDELVAMAGQRLQPSPYIEVSAVCTHPAHHGKGYASKLLAHQIEIIKAQLGIPFLHVKSDNQTAIKVYQSLGFEIRKEMSIYIIQKR